jgi:hypothetical protein
MGGVVDFLLVSECIALCWQVSGIQYDLIMGLRSGTCDPSHDQAIYVRIKKE